MLPLLRQTFALGTLARRVRRLQLLALEGAHARFDFGVGTRAIARRNFGRRFGTFAFLLDLDQAFQFSDAFPRSLFCCALGGIAQSHSFDCILFRGNPLRSFNCRLLFRGHALLRRGRGGFGGAGSLLLKLGGTLFGGKPFRDGMGCRSLCGVLIKRLFFKFFLQALAFGSLHCERALSGFTHPGRMRCRSFRGNAFARLFRKALLGGCAFDRSQARRFIGSGAVPCRNCRPLFSAAAFLGKGCRPRFGLRAPGGSGLQGLFGIGSCRGDTQRGTIRFGTDVSLGLCALLGSGTIMHGSCGFPVIGTFAALHRLNQQAG